MTDKLATLEARLEAAPEKSRERIDLLNQIAWEIWAANPARAGELTRESLADAEELEYDRRPRPRPQEPRPAPLHAIGGGAGAALATGSARVVRGARRPQGRSHRSTWPSLTSTGDSAISSAGLISP